MADDNPNPNLYASSTPLSAFNLQQLHLELLRRVQKRHFSGDQLVEFLLEHQNLWESVLSHDTGLPLFVENEDAFPLPRMSDIPWNEWNASTLYIYVLSKENAQTLIELGIKETYWHENGVFIHDHYSTEDILGDYEDDWRVICINLDIQR